MKYAMVIHQSDVRATRASPAERSEAEHEFDSLVRRWADLRAWGKVIAAARLAPPDAASIVTDGPYIEAKEAVGGFVLLDVDSEAEAVEIARSWATRPGIRIELRAVVEG